MLKRLILFTAVLVALAASTPIRAEILEQVLVKVNGDILTKTEFELRQVQALRNRPALANVSPTSPELQKAITEVTPMIVPSNVRKDRILCARTVSSARRTPLTTEKNVISRPSALQ